MKRNRTLFGLAAFLVASLCCILAFGVMQLPVTVVAGSNTTVSVVDNLDAGQQIYTVSATGGVSSVTASGAGITASPTSGAVVIANTGVTSLACSSPAFCSGATGAVTISSVAGTLGLPLLGQGLSSAPAFTGPTSVAGGGTGQVSFPNHTIPIGEGTSPFANTGTGSAGQLLASNGSSSDPSFTAFTLASPGTSGNIATSNGTDWVSSAPGLSKTLDTSATSVAFTTSLVTITSLTFAVPSGQVARISVVVWAESIDPSAQHHVLMAINGTTIASAGMPALNQVSTGPWDTQMVAMIPGIGGPVVSNTYNLQIKQDDIIPQTAPGDLFTPLATMKVEITSL